LALTYHKLGRTADAEKIWTKLFAKYGATYPVANSEHYAQWGDTARALDWLETGLRVRDPTLRELKVDPYLDPLRNEPRFQALERALKFPD
jgi:hypothetical protein